MSGGAITGAVVPVRVARSFRACRMSVRQEDGSSWRFVVQGLSRSANDRGPVILEMTRVTELQMQGGLNRCKMSDLNWQTFQTEPTEPAMLCIPRSPSESLKEGL